MFRIQMLHPESGFFLNTNHQSVRIEPLKSMLTGDEFPGGTFQIVDGRNEIQFGPVFRDRESLDPVADFAQAMRVPVLNPVYVDTDESDQSVSPIGVAIVFCLAIFVVFKLARKRMNSSLL